MRFDGYFTVPPKIFFQIRLIGSYVYVVLVFSVSVCENMMDLT